MQISVSQIRRSYLQACRLELNALKPGNVSVHSGGHGMSVDQFISSAEVSAEVITEPGIGVGERILNGVRATRQAVGDNTNLGILLLTCPLVEAALQVTEDLSLHDRLKSVLNRLSVEDARQCYRAIRIANPGGMGEVDQQDIADEPDITLLQAMRLSADRDRIAYQYIHNYIDIFEANLAIYSDYLKRWESPEWATTAVYLSQLVRVPDSLIGRKFGVLKAQEISDMIAPLAVQVLASQDPVLFENRLLSIDGHLKNIGINPGTTADLTVATLFVAALESASARGCPRG